MKLLSIIAEYNPFHNGHEYHLITSLRESQATHCMAIMSGSFLQRGEPALVDKWTRSRIAIKNGIDLIVELPFIYSCQSAEVFAYGAISTLDALNIVDVISFGSETPHLDKIAQIASLLTHEPQKYKSLLKDYLDKGISYAKARQYAVEKYLEDPSGLLAHPNNILAIEYMKWLYSLNSKISPITVERAHAGYHQLNEINNFAGATYIRNQIQQSDKVSPIKSLLPKATFEELSQYEQRGNKYQFLDEYYTLLVGELLKTSKESLRKIFDVNEGLENRILKASVNSANMDELLQQITSKRYAQTRIKRILMNFLMDHTENMVYKFFKNSEYRPYLRVLAFNRKGKEILKEIKTKSEIPIITNLSKDLSSLDSIQKYALNKDIISTNYYDLIGGKTKLNDDFRRKPEILL